ncbi:tetratricopeptide repeat protein, partial [Enterocloster asparagiformis]
KESLNPATDIVMMKYLTGFDQNGHVTFSYYRERLIKNRRGFLWEGRVHEAVTPRGNILYSPVEIEHRKLAAGDSDRNLRIYETMIGEGETLCPRHQFYYGRELYYHQRYEEAVKVFEHFLEEPDGWVENRIDACLQLSRCREQLGQKREAFLALTGSFLYDEPRAEILCEIGRLLIGERAYKTAAYWYQRALELTPRETSGAFVLQDCYGYIPYMQLCVCFDRLGDHKKAREYHLLARELKPEAEAVKQNQLYFDKLFQDEEG